MQTVNWLNWHNEVMFTHHYRERYYERVFKIQIPEQYMFEYVDKKIIKSMEKHFSIKFLNQMVKCYCDKECIFAYSDQLYIVFKNRKFITIRPN